MSKTPIHDELYGKNKNQWPSKPTIQDAMLQPAILESYNKIEVVKNAASQWEEETGINPLNMYCSRTGRIVGCINDSILHSNLTTIKSNDIEEIMDELTIRTILSMRPAPDLIYLNKDSMKALINHNPTAACIFLLGKAFESKELMFKKISPTHKSSKHKHQYDSSCIDEKIAWNRGIIEMSSRISKKIQVRNIKRFTMMLLEIDAKVGLHKIKPPSDCWGFDLLTDGNAFKDFMKLIRYYHKEIVKIEKAQFNWYNNINALSFETYFDLNRSKPKKLSEKARKQDRKINNMKSQLAELLRNTGSIEEILAETKHERKRAFVQMKPTGFKLKFKLKGSSNETKSSQI